MLLGWIHESTNFFKYIFQNFVSQFDNFELYHNLDRQGCFFSSFFALLSILDKHNRRKLLLSKLLPDYSVPINHLSWLVRQPPAIFHFSPTTFKSGSFIIKCHYSVYIIILTPFITLFATKCQPYFTKMEVITWRLATFIY